MNPFSILGVTPEATDEDIRLAYLEAVKRHPPERDAERFQAIVQAFQSIRTEEDRRKRDLFGPEDAAPNLAVWIDTLPNTLRRARLNVWLTVAKDSRPPEES
ncbi:MAG: J domain-containing protein [Planctomycetes bacterium]|nr:J domain-containing protein [Planctomycetota bacterium]